MTELRSKIQAIIDNAEPKTIGDDEAKHVEEILGDFSTSFSTLVLDTLERLYIEAGSFRGPGVRMKMKEQALKIVNEL